MIILFTIFYIIPLLTAITLAICCLVNTKIRDSYKQPFLVKHFVGIILIGIFPIANLVLLMVVVSTLIGFIGNSDFMNKEIK